MIRGYKVMLDSDLAKIYGTSTMRLNEQFRRNRKRFPKDFAFQLQREEFGVGQIALKYLLIEQVDACRVREGLARDRALADSTHAQEEEAALGRREKALENGPAHHVGILRRKMPTS